MTTVNRTRSQLVRRIRPVLQGIAFIGLLFASFSVSGGWTVLTALLKESATSQNTSPTSPDHLDPEALSTSPIPASTD